MRVRTARVKLTKAAGLDTLFALAKERNYAWIMGEGRIYADLEKVADKNGYTAWSYDFKGDDKTGIWVAVRTDLIAETEGFEEDKLRLSFIPTREGLGEVVLLSGDLGEVSAHSDRYKLIGETPTETFAEYEYSEQLYSVPALSY